MKIFWRIIMNDYKKLDSTELIEKGYLQEVNRRFFHPLGLALCIEYDDESVENTRLYIIDCRDEPDGLIFDLNNSSNERNAEFLEKFNLIETELNIRKIKREKLLGFFIEPIK